MQKTFAGFFLGVKLFISLFEVLKIHTFAKVSHGLRRKENTAKYHKNPRQFWNILSVKKASLRLSFGYCPDVFWVFLMEVFCWQWLRRTALGEEKIGLTKYQEAFWFCFFQWYFRLHYTFKYQLTWDTQKRIWRSSISAQKSMKITWEETTMTSN